jgi:hypothetical protein
MSKKLNLSHGSRLGVEMEMFWIWRRGGEGDEDGEQRRSVVERRVGEEEEKGTGRGAAATGRRRRGRIPSPLDANGDGMGMRTWTRGVDGDARSGRGQRRGQAGR